jgi:MinD-like ATPase involved in chromosome partitioning or flagellar assembly
VSLIALCSASGAPGVTTTVLALGWVWPVAHPGRRSLVLDADAAGSGILTGCLHARVPAGYGVLELVGNRRDAGSADLLDHAVAMDADATRLVLTGVVDPAQARQLGTLWTRVADTVPELGTAGVDVLADVGRLGHRYEPTALLERADAVVVVVRATLPQVSSAAAALVYLRKLRAPSAQCTVLIVDAGATYSAKEVARALDVPAPHVLPDDRRTAAVLSDGGSVGWAFERSALVRAATTVAGDLGPELAPATATAEVRR